MGGTKVFQSFPKKLKWVFFVCFFYILDLIILSLIVLDLKKVNTVSVVFPAATFLSVLAWSCSPSQPPTVQLCGELFLLYGFSGHSKQQFSLCRKPLKSEFTNTHIIVSLSSLHKLSHWFSFTVLTFYVSFSVLSQKREDESGLVPNSEPLCSLHYQPKRPHLPAANILSSHFWDIAMQLHCRDAKEVQPGWACHVQY